MTGNDNFRVYKLTQSELIDLVTATSCIPLLDKDGNATKSQQQACNEVWVKIAKDRKVHMKSIYPSPDGHHMKFMALPLEFEFPENVLANKE